MILILTIYNILTALAAIFLAGCIYARFGYWSRAMSKIPGKKTYPLIGNLFDTFFLGPVTGFQFVRSLKEKGRVTKIEMAIVGAVNIYHPDDIEKVVSTTRFNDKKIPYNFLYSWLCEGLLVSNGEKWKQRRRLLTPAFHFNVLKRFCITFNEQTAKLLQWIEEQSTKERVDVTPLITKATLNVMCETSMGTSESRSSASVISEYFKALHDFGGIIQKRYFKVPFHLDWIYKFSFLAQKEKKVVLDMHNFTKKIIAERKEYRKRNGFPSDSGDFEVYSGKERLAMLDLLLENERDGKIDLNGIREEVDTFLFEGHDTTAMALSFMIMRIANEPEIQKKIYEELQNIFGDSDRYPEQADFNEMKYLECCIKESLRIYPSVPFIARYADQEVELGGYTVPAKTVLHIHIFDLHRDPSLYPDPERFVPERFLPEQCASRHPYAYIPFSAGPRNCIGQKFAMMELKTVMSSILRKYHVDPVTKPEDVVFIADLVLRSRDPMYVRFRPRKD